MKLKYKFLIDAVMFILIWICMEYDLTGGFLHELLGIILILGFLVHAFINRKYYSTMMKKMMAGDELSTKQIVSFFINVILLLASIVMLISSLVISMDLLPFIRNYVGMLFMWRVIHIISSLVLLTCIFIHAVLHGKMILSVIAKHVNASAVMKVIKMASRVVAVVLAAIIVKINVENVRGIIPTESGKKINSNSVYIESESSEAITQKSEVVSDTDNKVEEEEVADVPTLDSYLRNLNCDGCHRHCSLASPQCGTGRRAAQEAEADYQELYGE